jgi:hypothetical protein
MAVQVAQASAPAFKATASNTLSQMAVVVDAQHVGGQEQTRLAPACVLSNPFSKRELILGFGLGIRRRFLDTRRHCRALRRLDLSLGPKPMVDVAAMGAAFIFPNLIRPLFDLLPKRLIYHVWGSFLPGDHFGSPPFHLANHRHQQLNSLVQGDPSLIEV